LALRGRRPTRLQRVLNSAPRIVSNTRKFDRGLTHFRRSQLHWLDVVDQVRFRVCVQVFRCLHKMAPEYMSTYANPSPASLAVATCDRLTVVISISHVWNLLRTEDVHLHTPALRIGTHFLLTIVFLFHLLSSTSKPLSSLSTRLAYVARWGSFTKTRYINSLWLLCIICPKCCGCITLCRRQSFRKE